MAVSGENFPGLQGLEEQMKDRDAEIHGYRPYHPG